MPQDPLQIMPHLFGNLVDLMDKGLGDPSSLIKYVNEGEVSPPPSIQSMDAITTIDDEYPTYKQLVEETGDPELAMAMAALRVAEKGQIEKSIKERRDISNDKKDRLKRAAASLMLGGQNLELVPDINNPLIQDHAKAFDVKPADLVNKLTEGFSPAELEDKRPAIVSRIPAINPAAGLGPSAGAGFQDIYDPVNAPAPLPTREQGLAIRQPTETGATGVPGISPEFQAQVAAGPGIRREEDPFKKFEYNPRIDEIIPGQSDAALADAAKTEDMGGDPDRFVPVGTMQEFTRQIPKIVEDNWEHWLSAAAGPLATGTTAPATTEIISTTTGTGTGVPEQTLLGLWKNEMGSLQRRYNEGTISLVETRAELARLLASEDIADTAWANVTPEGVLYGIGEGFGPNNISWSSWEGRKQGLKQPVTTVQDTQPLVVQPTKVAAPAPGKEITPATIGIGEPSAVYRPESEFYTSRLTSLNNLASDPDAFLGQHEGSNYYYDSESKGFYVFDQTTNVIEEYLNPASTKTGTDMEFDQYNFGNIAFTHDQGTGKWTSGISTGTAPITGVSQFETPPMGWTLPPSEQWELLRARQMSEKLPEGGRINPDDPMWKARMYGYQPAMGQYLLSGATGPFSEWATTTPKMTEEERSRAFQNLIDVSGGAYAGTGPDVFATQPLSPVQGYLAEKEKVISMIMAGMGAGQGYGARSLRTQIGKEFDVYSAQMAAQGRPITAFVEDFSKKYNLGITQEVT